MLTLFTGLFLCINFISCSKDTRALDDEPSKILKRGLGPDPESLDPQLARSESALTVVRDLYEGLVSFSTKGELVPGVAESWSYNKSDHCIHFKLRTEAKWSNGDRVTAKDFIRAWNFAIDPRNNAPYADLLLPFTKGSSDDSFGKTQLNVSSMKADQLLVCVPYFTCLLYTSPSPRDS